MVLWYFFHTLLLMNRCELVVRTPHDKDQVWIYPTLSPRESTKYAGFTEAVFFLSK